MATLRMMKEINHQHLMIEEVIVLLLLPLL